MWCLKREMFSLRSQLRLLFYDCLKLRCDKPDANRDANIAEGLQTYQTNMTYSGKHGCMGSFCLLV